MDKALLDTDMLSEMLKGVDLVVAAKAKSYHAAIGYYTTSVITVMEVVKGFHKVGRQQRVRQFLSTLSTVEVLVFDSACAELAGRIYADLERTGQPIGRADPMIAAIALRHDLTLVTGNLSHYQRIVSLGYDLKLENWRN
jgi:tRNA(fMet)-specific endonuclease VapC